MKGWDKTDAGNLKVLPITSWETASFMRGKAAGLRIEYAEEDNPTERRALQVVLTPSMLAELIQSLMALDRQMTSEQATPAVDEPGAESSP